MPCWVVPAVASEIWNVPVEQILTAVRAGQIPSKRESGFTFIDVAPDSAADSARPARPASTRSAAVPYKPVRLRQTPGEPILLPRPAEIVSPVERAALERDPTLAGVGAEHPSDDVNITEPLSMGDWRRGRRTAACRRLPPGQAA